MISKNTCKKIVDQACAYARGKCDGIEVLVSGSNIATSRFANNSMTQNQSPIRVGVSVRVIVDGRQTRLSTDDMSRAGVEKVIDNAILAAKLLEKDETLLPLPEAGLTAKAEATALLRYHAKTAKMTAAARADAIAQIIAVAKDNGLKAAGVYATGVKFIARGDSNGAFQYHEESSAECSITMVGANSTGWSKAHHPDHKFVNARALALQAAKTAVESANAQDVEPGRYVTILPPSAVLDLLTFLWYDFAGTSHSDKLSSLLDKVGQKVFGANVTIRDDVFHPQQAGEPFDGEGLPRKPLTLVEAGVVKNLVHGRKSAKTFGTEPTGHGLTEPSGMGEYPTNLVMEGGEVSLEEMISTTKKGILLSRVWYVRTVDPSIVLLTGMTRDGTFLIEDGKVTGPVKNLRFNVSIHDLLNNVLQLSPAVRAAGEEGFPAVVPAMKVANFNFTSTTKF